jgi:hypothetical protein
MTRSGSLYEHPTWAPRIAGSGGSAWPTANAGDERAGSSNLDHREQTSLPRSAENWQTPKSPSGGNVSRGGHRKDEPLLAGQAERWAVPEIGPWAEGKYPTPSGTPYGTSQNEGEVPHARPSRGTPSLETWASSHPVRVITPDGRKLSPTVLSTSERRRLNPGFVCWLMGWPWWWTRAEPISFAARGMELYLCRLRSLLWSCFDE